MRSEPKWNTRRIDFTMHRLKSINRIRWEGTRQSMRTTETLATRHP